MNRTPTPPKLAEFTLKSVGCGLVFGVMFGAANAYLGLKAGLTVSTSIPIAVLSVAVFRAFRGGTVLEANMAQTVGSASSSLASGTIFTIPALFMWGLAPPWWQMGILAGLGGLLGILAMVPLRRLLIVKADAELPYPEGRACAEVIKATGGSAAGSSWIFLGIGIGAALKLVLSGFHLLPEEAGRDLPFLPGADLAIKISPALLAVGYIVGFRAASVMVAGSLVTALVLKPLIINMHGLGAVSAGGAAAGPKGMDDLIRYLGAGAVAAAGVITIFKTLPTMVRSFQAVVTGLRAGAGEASAERTDRDLPGGLLLAGLGAVVLVLALVPGIFAGDLPLAGRAAAAVGVLLFGLVFVPVSSRLVGVIGVSSNPTSAMALITLVGTAAAFAAAGWGGDEGRAAVLTVGTVVCIAASKAGDISQDLKTGYLVQGTPALQQYGQLIAAAVACWAVAGVMTAIGENPGFTGPDAMPAPQARLMKTVVEAVLGANLPWDLVLTGAALGGTGALAGLPPLPFALGIYLPLSTMAAIFLGGCLRGLTEKRKTAAAPGVPAAQTGILCASGFVAGEGLAGVLLAGWALATHQVRYKAPPPEGIEMILSLVLLAVAGFALARAARARPAA